MQARVSGVSLLLKRLCWTFGLVTLLLQAGSASAQEKEWDKHMKEGGKAYAKGMSKKYYWPGLASQTNTAGAPDFAKAEKEFLDALAVAQSFPAGDVRTAHTLGGLADTYAEERKFDEAEARGKQAIALLEGSLTTNNPELGYASISMALIYESESKPEQAAPLWDRALAILKKTGKVNPELFSHLELWALNFDTAGQMQIYQFIVQLKESASAPGKDLRDDLVSLARAQKGSEAEQTRIRILEIDKTAYGPDSPITIGDVYLLGSLYADEGKYTAALQLLQRSLELNEKAIQSRAPCNPRAFWKSLNGRIDCMSQDAAMPRYYRELAEVYAAIGRYPEAEEIYKQLISAAEAKTHGNRKLTESDLTEDMGRLARVYSDEHRYDEALETMKRCAAVAEAIAESKPGESQGKLSLASVYVWFAQADLAEIDREKGDNAAAEPVFQQALEMTEHMRLAPGHPKLAQLLDNYATLLRDEGKNAKAEPLYKRALEVWAKARYPDHPDVAVTLTDYATLLRKTDRAAEAESLETRASAIRAQAAAPSPVN